ncbi:MAG: hypothetical protein ACR2NN_17795 [Bryobacteraceae bacterium]
MLPAFGEDLVHSVFLPKAPLANELDLNARFRRHLSAFSRIRFRNGSANFG